jgi:hypothetical protein
MKKVLSILLAFTVVFSMMLGFPLTAWADENSDNNNGAVIIDGAERGKPTVTSGDYTYVPEGKTAIITKYSGKASKVTIPDTLDGLTVTTIGLGAFQSNGGLLSVIIPNSVTKISGYSFDGCTNLSDITIPNSVTFTGEFAECSSLTSVTIQNGITNIPQEMFRQCSSLYAAGQHNRNW